MIRIETQNISFFYSHQRIFSNINFKCQSGEKIQFTGDNGAGKTTFLKILSSIFKPQSGTVDFFHFSKKINQSDFRKKMGICIDASHMFHHFSVEENLKLYQKLYTGKYSPEIINHWVEKFHLQAYMKTAIQNLSQGEQKKISLIKSLFHSPTVLVFDEPTNSLDETSKKTLSEIFSNLSKDHLLLVSTHDIEWASRWSNREVKIKKGTL